MTDKNIPQTDSITELAKFWDTHDLTDFEDELEEVEEVFYLPKAEVELLVPLQLKELESIEKIASDAGISEDILVRQWILERLEEA